MLKWATYTVCAAASIGLLWLSIVGKLQIGADSLDWKEMVAAITSLWCVWLGVKEHVWLWPITIAASVFTAAVCLQAQLFSDASLQFVYVILSFLGWYWWLFGGKNRSELPVSKVSLKELTLSLIAGALGTAILIPVLMHIHDSAPFWDALTSAYSLVALYLQTRKLIENWTAWVIVDVIYMPLYLSKKLVLLALLNIPYLVLAVIGYIEWRKSLLSGQMANAVME
jgi:nicotinamide mononucleotide transporter